MAGSNFVKENKDIQELCQRCGGRYVVLNMKDRQQIPELMEMVETMRNTPVYSSLTFLRALGDKVLKQETDFKMLQEKLVKMNTNSDNTEQQSTDCLRVVLIGKTGCGKSSTGNTILGKKEFEAKRSQTSITKHCGKAQREWNGRRLVVVDTPGLFDSSLSNEEVQDELLNCVTLVAPGPHVFLLVVKIDSKFTDEEKKTVELIKKTFGKGSEKFTIVLLTGGDQLEEDQSVEEFIDEGEDSFKKLLNDCGGRYQVFNNKDKENRTQELIGKIDSMVERNGGGWYTNEMLQEAEAAIKKEMQRILKEKEEIMQKEKEEFERKHKEKLEELEKRLEQERAEKEREREEKAKELQEGEDEIRKEKELKERELKRMEEERRESKLKEEEERKNLQKQLESLDQQIQTQRDEKQNVDKNLEETREKLSKKQEEWEKERREWWEKQRRKEEQRKIKELEEKYNKEKENMKNKKK